MLESLQAVAPETWLIVAGVSLLIGVAGFALGRRSAAGTEQVRELEGALDDARAAADGATAELDRYRGNVADHFAETSEKLRDLTLQYRAVYDHLAVGAGELCPEGFERLEGVLGAAALPEASSSGQEGGDLAEELEIDEPTDPPSEPRASEASAADPDTDERTSG